MLDEKNKAILSKVWKLSDESKSDKLQFFDTFMATQSDQINKEYRKWRFEIDRETVLHYSFGEYNLLIFRFPNSSRNKPLECRPY